MESAASLFVAEERNGMTRSVLARRSELEIKMDVLRAVGAGATKPTQVMYKANLSWIALQVKLRILLSGGLLKEIPLGNRKQYEITDKGIELLRNYAHIVTAVRGTSVVARY